MTKLERRIELAIDGIIADLTDRRGLRQEWEQIDDDIKTEIRNTWLDIMYIELNREER